MCILAGYTALLPWFVCLANGNPVTKEVLSTGWSPVLAAMAISSVGGLILDYTVATYKGIAVFQVRSPPCSFRPPASKSMGSRVIISSPIGKEKLCRVAK